MAASTTQKARYIQQARSALTNLYEAAAQCRHIQDTGTDMGIVPSGLVDADFANDDIGITAVDFQAATFSANRAVNAVDRATIAKAKL